MTEDCIRLVNISNERCVKCGAVGLEMHKAGMLFRRFVYCAACCPACKPWSVAAPRPESQAKGHSQWADAGWGPERDAPGRVIDPWYRDTRREPQRWVPKINWFRRNR